MGNQNSTRTVVKRTHDYYGPYTRIIHASYYITDIAIIRSFIDVWNI